MATIPCKRCNGEGRTAPVTKTDPLTGAEVTTRPQCPPCQGKGYTKTPENTPQDKKKENKPKKKWWQ